MGPSTTSMDERSASSSSYFSRPSSCRLLLRVYSAEGLRHVSSHGTYCKLYVGRTDMVRGSGAFALRTQKLTSSTSSHSFGGLLQSQFGSSSRSNTAQRPTTPLPPISSSEGDLSGNNNNMRVLKTQVQKGKRSDPVWNEKFDIPVLDLNEDMLSIRVKSARLMSSPAIGACSVSLKHLTGIGTTTIDRWVELRRGKKDAGRIRLQLRLVDPSIARLQNSDPTTRARNQQNSDAYLSLPAEETFEEIAKRMKKTSRRDHKYHRSARHFDGRPVTALGSSSGSNRSASDKEEDQKRVAATRDNSASATSNESNDDSEPASDVSVSPVVSPRLDRASEDDGLSLADASPTVSGQIAGKARPSPSMAAAAMGLDASYGHHGTMRRSELEHSEMKMAEMSRKSRVPRSSRTSKHQVPQEDDDDDDEFDDEYDNRGKSTKRWVGNHTNLSVLSSTLDPRESSRMDFDDDDDDDNEWDSMDKREKSANSGSASFVLSSTASSTLDPRESSRFSFSDSESEDEDDEVKSEKAREQQRQQWQMEQRKKQLVGIKEVSQSMSDEESDDDSEDEDDYNDELDLNLPRMQFPPTIATLLSRESMNVLIEEEDDEEEDLESYKMSEDFIPMLEASSPMSVDSVDCALRRSSFD